MVASPSEAAWRLVPAVSRLIVSLALALGLVGSAPGAADDALGSAPTLSAPGLSAYAGRWIRVEDAVAEAARLEAIDAAVANLSWLVRGMAASVLRKSAVPPGALAFEWHGGVLRQVVEASEGRFERPVEPGGPPLELTDPNGEPFTASWQWTRDGLEVRWVQARATGTTRYRFEADRDGLHVAHRIEVTALDGVQPIEYESRFDRVRSLPTVSAAPEMRVAEPRHAPSVGAPPKAR